MFFRHSSYHSLSSSPPLDGKNDACSASNNNNKLLLHKGLQFFMFLQVFVVTFCCLFAMNSESTDHKTLPLVEALYNPRTHVLLPLLSGLSYILSVAVLYSLFPTSHLYLLRLGLLLCTLSLALLFSFFAAYFVCDPIIRLARDNTLDRILVLTPSGQGSYGIIPSDFGKNQNNDLLLAPLSTLSELGPGWVAESRPDFFQCAASTLYAHNGRLLVAIALCNVNSAFLITSAIAYTFRGTFHATIHAIVLYSFVFIILVNGISAIVINQIEWDWRMLGLGLMSAFVSSYLSAAAIHTPLPPPSSSPQTTTANTASASLLPKFVSSKPLTAPVTIVRAAWLTIQPFLAMQAFFEKLEEEDEEPAPTTAKSNVAENPDPSPYHHV
jgi:hypothetical protein